VSRPKCCRHIGCLPDKNYFKPRGIPSSQLEEVVLSLDEYEAVRLADFQQFYQEKAAAQMNVSRQTFGRIIESAHRKIADVLMNGKALKIEGGEVSVGETRHMECPECHKAFGVNNEPTQEETCPYCRKLKK
jgi:uncharacterized protein